MADFTISTRRCPSVQHDVRNFYSVSISGYHIAEAGANPISQLAFTLSNGFTFVEAYLARGMHIDDFAPNLSALARLRETVIANRNVFAELMNAARVCSLGQIINALFEVGGQYRQSM